MITYNKPLKLLNIMHTIPELAWLIILVIFLEDFLLEAIKCLLNRNFLQGCIFFESYVCVILWSALTPPEHHLCFLSYESF